MLFQSGIAVKEIARRLQRSRGAISSRLKIYRSVALAVIGMVAVAGPAQPWIGDDLGNKNEISQNVAMLVVEPRIYAGNPLSEHILMTNYSYAKVIAQNAIYDAAVGVLEDKGYRVHSMQLPRETEERSPEEMKSLAQVWDEVIQFTEVGKPDKRKKIPYRIDPQPSVFGTYGGVDILVFVECYGDFNYKLTWKEDAAGKLLVAAATTALTGWAVIFAGSNTMLDYKMSFFDAKTGDLIWFKEGTQTRTEISSKGRLISVFMGIFEREVPVCNKILTDKKFGSKRSAIHSLAKGAVE